MADLNDTEKAQLQNLVTRIRQNADALRGIWSDLVRHNDTSAWMTGVHTVAEINAALASFTGNEAAGFMVADLAAALSAASKTQTALAAAEKAAVVKLSHGT